SRGSVCTRLGNTRNRQAAGCGSPAGPCTVRGGGTGEGRSTQMEVARASTMYRVRFTRGTARRVLEDLAAPRATQKLRVVLGGLTGPLGADVFLLVAGGRLLGAFSTHVDGARAL